jgi:O-antigen/teichoic acid export membrane protein
MAVSLAGITKGILNLGIGESLARLGTVITIVLLSHHYGAFIVGVFTLGMTVSYYVQPVIDFGLRHVGARLMAQYPSQGSQILQRVQKRRLLMAAAVLPLTMIYAMSARVPTELKLWLFIFSGSTVLYSFSLEWAAWGKEHLRLVGISRAMVPLGILAGLVVGWDTPRVLWWMALGNGVAFALQALLFRVWWARSNDDKDVCPTQLKEIKHALALRRTSMMGLSMFCTLAFSSIDMLMLGVMRSSTDVGAYSAAYRIVNQVLVSYYLLTSAIYPILARQTFEGRRKALNPKLIYVLMGLGVAIALLITVGRRGLVLLLFGPQFATSTGLLLLLVWAIPLDFVTSYLSAAYLAWSMERSVLFCMAAAAAANIILNVLWIPNYGPMAAAINTLISYALLLVGLIVAGYSIRGSQLPTSAEDAGNGSQALSN